MTEKYTYKKIIINMPYSFCMNNIFNKGLKPIFYITYIYIAARICPINSITITIRNILSECRTKIPRNRDESFADVVASLQYLNDNGFIDLMGCSPTDLAYDTPINISINRSMFFPLREYFKMNYYDYHKILVNGMKKKHSKPEYCVMLYLYIGSHFIDRNDLPRKCFFEKRYNTCKKLGISEYRYDKCTDFLDECQIFVKWRSGIRRNRSGEVKTIPNIYTHWDMNSYKYYIQALKKLTEIYNEKELLSMIQLDEKRLKLLKRT